jgi:hypothetical protein
MEIQAVTATCSNVSGFDQGVRWSQAQAQQLPKLSTQTSSAQSEGDAPQGMLVCFESHSLQCSCF